MANRVLAFIDVSASSWGANESSVADTVAAIADLPGSTILLFVAAGLTGAVNTDLSLQAISVRVANLHTDRVQAFFSASAVCIDFTLEMTHFAPTFMQRWTLTLRASLWDPDAASLRGGDPSKPGGTGATNILTLHLAVGIWTACTLLLAGIDTLEVDADL